MAAKTLVVLLFLLIGTMGVLLRPCFADEARSASSEVLPVEIPADCRCFVCGMRCDGSSPFTAQGIKDGNRVFFCDVGDMLYARGSDGVALQALVQDMTSRRWIPAETAWYVRHARWHTPMAWGIAAFGERREAEAFGVPMSVEQAMETVR